MTTNGGNILLRPVEYETIYNCWNGKWKSCIKTRNIPEDKKNCALKKIIDTIDSQKLLDALKDPQEKEKEITPQEEYEYRNELIKYIYKTYKCRIPFERLQEKKLDRVKISRESEFAHQNDGEWTNLGETSDHGWYKVCFDNGYKNNYTLDDLIIVNATNANDEEKIKTINETILQNMAIESRKEFLDRIALLLFDASQKDEDIMNRMFPNNNFKEWDKIVMNEAANEKYSYSKEWSTWVVVNTWRYTSYIRFDTLTGGDHWNPTWDIENKYMINLSESGTRKITLDDVVNNISEVLKTLEEQKKESSLDKKKLVTQLLLKENFLLPWEEEGNYVLNYREMTKFIAPKLYSTYGNKDIYNEIDMCAPPSESHPNVLKFAFSTWCDYNRCTYCDLYKQVKYCPKTFEQIKEHIDKVLESVEENREDIERVFIGSGNALALDEKTLVKSLDYINELLYPRRISMYARTKDINKKWSESLQKLNDAWLTNLYRWAETWSDEILQYVKKWTTLNEMLEASKTLAKTNINLSVTLMPGIWGVRFDKENIEWTIKFLNATNTQYITFMAITPSPNSEYDLIMKEEMMANKNRPLSNVEVVKQIKAILKWLEPKGQKIGMYGPEIHGVDYNPFYFKVTFDEKWKKKANKLCKEYLKTHVI